MCTTRQDRHGKTEKHSDNQLIVLKVNVVTEDPRGMRTENTTRISFSGIVDYENVIYNENCCRPDVDGRQFDCVKNTYQNVEYKFRKISRFRYVGALTAFRD